MPDFIRFNYLWLALCWYIVLLTLGLRTIVIHSRCTYQHGGMFDDTENSTAVLGLFFFGALVALAWLPLLVVALLTGPGLALGYERRRQLRQKDEDAKRLREAEQALRRDGFDL